MILVCQFVIHSPLNWLIVFEMFTNQFCLGNHPKGWFFVLASPWFLNVSLIVLTSFFSDAKVIFISETSLYENFWTFSGCWLKCFLLAKFAKKKNYLYFVNWFGKTQLEVLPFLHCILWNLLNLHELLDQWSRPFKSDSVCTAYPEPSQTSKMELFGKKGNSWNLFAIFA